MHLIAHTLIGPDKFWVGKCFYPIRNDRCFCRLFASVVVSGTTKVVPREMACSGF